MVRWRENLCVTLPISCLRLKLSRSFVQLHRGTVLGDEFDQVSWGTSL